MAARRIVSYPRRGEVYLVNFDPTLGAEIKKTRPALILQNDIGNRYSPLTIVAAITSQYEERLYPHQVLVVAPEGGMKKNSAVLLNQIRSVIKRGWSSDWERSRRIRCGGWTGRSRSA